MSKNSYCIVIDDSYHRIRPKYPTHPVCLPLSVYLMLLVKKLGIILAIIAVLILGMTLIDKIVPKPSDIAVPVLDFIYLVGLFFLMLAALKKIKIKTYAKLSDAIENPEGYKYQGRVLFSHSPHYQLHLKHFEAHGTWIMPHSVIENQEDNAAYNSDSTEGTAATEAFNGHF